MRRFIITTAAVILLSCFAVALAGGAGSSSDPLISLSYIRDTYLPNIINQTQAKADAQLKGKYDAALAQITDAADQAVINAVSAEVINKLNGGLTSSFSEYTLNAGDQVTGKPGTGIILRSGTAVLSGPANGVLVNITAGGERKTGSAATQNIYYMVVADNQTGVKVTSATAQVALSGGFTVTKAYTAQYTAVADALKSMRLFLGTNLGYELERAPTRVEALVMMLRLFGEETNAKSYTGSHPFNDVPAWAKCYVAYAYSKGYTNGISSTQYGSTMSATSAHYLTFVLRALGYSDVSGDFAWSSSVAFAVSSGVISNADQFKITNGVFYRDYVAYVSYRALSASLKGTQTTLADRLIETGTITASEFEAAKTISGLS